MASDFSIRHAAHLIKRGGIIAYPTDTIYGLGCDPYNPDAVALINTIKHRPSNKPFILLAANIDQIKSLVLLNKKQEDTITENTQPTSWIISASKHAPSWLIDENNTVTIRISQNHTIENLCSALGHAIISTSANISGKKPARNTIDLHRYFHHSVDKILASDQKLMNSPSTIIRLCDNHVIRRKQ